MCGDEYGLRLFWIVGVKRGWQSIDSEAEGLIKGLVAGDEKNSPPPPSVLFMSSPWMNEYYISKLKKFCGKEKVLRLLWIDGLRRGWQSIDSEVGGGIKDYVDG